MQLILGTLAFALNCGIALAIALRWHLRPKGAFFAGWATSFPIQFLLRIVIVHWIEGSTLDERNSAGLLDFTAGLLPGLMTAWAITLTSANPVGRIGKVSLPLTPVRGAVIAIALYASIFISAFIYGITSKDPFSLLLPVMVASPTSFALVGLKEKLGTELALFMSGTINGGLWFLIVVIFGNIGILLRRSAASSGSGLPVKP